MSQRQYTLGERAIIYSAIAGGATRGEINEALLKEQSRTGMSPRTVPESSYLMVKHTYLPRIGFKGLWDQIQTRSINKARKSNIFTKWKRRQFESNRFSYWNKFRTEFQDLLETEYPITLNTTGKLFNYVLCDNSEWEDFLRYSEKIRTQLNTNFAEKIDDLDSKYWDFHFNNKVFTLHFNSMVGDVKLLTDRSNGTTEFQELLKQLGEK